MDRAIRLMSCNDPFPALSSPPLLVPQLTFIRARFSKPLLNADFLRARERALPNFLVPEDWTSVRVYGREHTNNCCA